MDRKDYQVDVEIIKNNDKQSVGSDSELGV